MSHSNGDHAAAGVSIAVMDEYPALVDGLVDGLATVEGFTVAVRAATGADLLAQLRVHPCGVVVAEPWLRSDDGLAALAGILSAQPDVTVVVFSRLWDDRRVNQLMNLGARAYVPKSTPVSSLPAIVRSAMAGMETRPSATQAPGDLALTPRETEVLALAAAGLGNAAIGRQLFVTERTVKFHLQNAYRKLGAGNRTEASVIARRRGLLS